MTTYVCTLNFWAKNLQVYSGHEDRTRIFLIFCFVLRTRGAALLLFVSVQTWRTYLNVSQSGILLFPSIIADINHNVHNGMAWCTLESNQFIINYYFSDIRNASRSSPQRFDFNFTLYSFLFRNVLDTESCRIFCSCYFYWYFIPWVWCSFDQFILVAFSDLRSCTGQRNTKSLPSFKKSHFISYITFLFIVKRPPNLS